MYYLTTCYTHHEPSLYTKKPITLGEHIRKCRIEGGLHQRAVAQKIGVTESTIWNWEHGIKPSLRHIPRILDFIGKNLFEPSSNEPIERLKCFKVRNGLSYERLGTLMKKDPEQLTDWLSGRHKPLQKSIREIEMFLQKNQTSETVTK